MEVGGDGRDIDIRSRPSCLADLFLCCHILVRLTDTRSCGRNAEILLRISDLGISGSLWR